MEYPRTLNYTQSNHQPLAHVLVTDCWLMIAFTSGVGLSPISLSLSLPLSFPVFFLLFFLACVTGADILKVFDEATEPLIIEDSKFVFVSGVVWHLAQISSRNYRQCSRHLSAVTNLTNLTNLASEQATPSYFTFNRINKDDKPAYFVLISNH